MSILIKLYILNMCSLFYFNWTTIKFFFLKMLDEITNGVSVDKEQKPKAGP